MIQKIQKIEGVGRYHRYSAESLSSTQQPDTFKKMNLIYGENGTGKTTLTHIFRSLKGDNEVLLKKTSFNYEGSPEIELLTDRESALKFQYQAFQWNQFESNLEIFDVHFINDHIYTGLEIQNTHKKKLFEIIVGDKGIRLKQAIQDTKIRIQKGNKIVRETGKAVEQAIGHSYSALEYAALEADPEIVEKIEWKKREIATAKNHQAIQAKASLKVLPTLSMPFDKGKGTAILSQSLAFISTSYLEKIQTHKTHLGMDGKAEEWLQQGFESTYDDQCPFCLRPMETGIEILEAYQQYFNATYKQLIVDIGAINQVLTQSNIEATLIQIDNAINLNKELIDFWKQYLPGIPRLSNLSEEQADIIASFEKVKNLFHQKMTNPIEAVATEEVAQFEQAIQQMMDKVNTMNEAILSYKESIDLLKSHEDTDIAGIEKELFQLLAIQKRADPSIDQHCADLKKYTLAIEKLKKQNKANSTELNDYKELIFKNYLGTINRYLKHFTPYLSLQKMTSAYMGSSTEPIVKFALCIHDKEVVHIDKGKQPAMKYALSEGDKNALALSFFLTKLEMDPELSEKTIIFDDPVSSFDAGRLSKMLAQLLHFGQEAKQLFFLTHNYNLGVELIQLFEKEKMDYSTNQLLVADDTSILTKFIGVE